MSLDIKISVAAVWRMTFGNSQPLTFIHCIENYLGGISASIIPLASRCSIFRVWQISYALKQQSRERKIFIFFRLIIFKSRQFQQLLASTDLWNYEYCSVATFYVWWLKSYVCHYAAHIYFQHPANLFPTLRKLSAGNGVRIISGTSSSNYASMPILVRKESSRFI